MLLNKQQVRDVDDLPSVLVSVPEWGGDVKVQLMSAKRRIAFEKKNVLAKTEVETMIYLIMYSCINEDGSLLFDPENDFDFLSNKSASALMQVFDSAVNISTLSKKGIQEKAKNS